MVEQGVLATSSAVSPAIPMVARWIANGNKGQTAWESCTKTSDGGTQTSKRVIVKGMENGGAIFFSELVRGMRVKRRLND